MKPPSAFAFALSAGRAASARGNRHVFNPDLNRSGFGPSLTRKGNDMDSASVKKAVALETALSALREYRAGLPLAKKKGATGAKVAGILADLEQLADRVASR